MLSNLAKTLRQLADACDKAEQGDQQAKDFIADYIAIDGYWSAITVGHGIAEHLKQNNPKPGTICVCCRGPVRNKICATCHYET